MNFFFQVQVARELVQGNSSISERRVLSPFKDNYCSPKALLFRNLVNSLQALALSLSLFRLFVRPFGSTVRLPVRFALPFALLHPASLML